MTKTEKFKGSCGNLHQFTGHKPLETKGETIIDIFKIYQDYIYIVSIKVHKSKKRKNDVTCLIQRAA